MQRHSNDVQEPKPTRRAYYWTDCWHGDSRGWDGHQGTRMPAPVALLWRTRVHGGGHWIRETEHVITGKQQKVAVIQQETSITGTVPQLSSAVPWNLGPQGDLGGAQ